MTPPSAICPTTFSSAMRAIIFMAIPLSVAQMLTVSIMTADIWMMGRMSTIDLAAGSLAIRFYQPFYFFSLGILTIVGPLVSQGLGSGDDRHVRRSFRQGLVVALGFGTLFAIPVSQGDWLLPVLGQDQAISKHAKTYLILSAISMPVLNIFIIFRLFVIAHDQPRIQLQAVIFGLILNIILNYLFAYGFGPLPALGIEGIALATLCAYIAMNMYLGWVIQTKLPFKAFAPFQRLWVMDWDLTLRQLRLGIPSAILVTTETGMFTAAALMVGVYGSHAIAAASIVVQIAAIAFMLPLGISIAASIQLGRAAGMKHAQNILIIGKAALLCTTAITAIVMIIIWLAMDLILITFLASTNPDYEAIRTVAVGLFIITALFQVPDGLQAVLSGGLRGLNDTFWPAIIGFISFWGIGLGSGYILGFWFGLGPTAIWSGVAIGLTAATIGLYVRWHLRMKAIAAGGQILTK